MLLKLSARGLRALGGTSTAPFIVRIAHRTAPGASSGADEALLLDEPNAAAPLGFRAYLLRARSPITHHDAYVLGEDHDYVSPGDVVRIDPRRGALTTLYRRSSAFNTFLVTEQCDNFCTMCSQPPKARDDSWLVDDLERAVPLVSPDAAEIGISGGEPALLGERLVGLLRLMRDHLPRTAVHVLSNGRRFADRAFVRDIAAIGHSDLMIGVPLYADLPEVHDYVVQARGAFDETLRGILNLKRERVRVELRFVIHRDTVERLPDFARFVARNLTFVDHVALMGLELVGFARSNLEVLWVDPVDYQDALLAAVATLDRAGMPVSVFNHQLCTLDRRLWRFARRSISDWKNAYFAECDACGQRADCGGFFASSTLRRSRGVRALLAADPLTARATTGRPPA
ncbi:MAG TPA: His-Xaa-Ser system radical SAM maturase HxsC [Byssovorax sp.]